MRFGLRRCNRVDGVVDDRWEAVPDELVLCLPAGASTSLGRNQTLEMDESQHRVLSAHVLLLADRVAALFLSEKPGSRRRPANHRLMAAAARETRSHIQRRLRRAFFRSGDAHPQSTTVTKSGVDELRFEGNRTIDKIEIKTMISRELRACAPCSRERSATVPLPRPVARHDLYRAETQDQADFRAVLVDASALSEGITVGARNYVLCRDPAST